MFILTFAGCIGSLRENIFLLKCFSFCLSVIFFAEIIVGILGFVYKEWFTDQFESFINKTVVDYREDPDLQNIVDFTQTYFKCCGGAGPDDWDNNPYFNCTHTVYVNGAEFSLVESCGVPFSCCVPLESDGDETISVLNTQCGYGVRSDLLSNQELVQKIYTDGCIESFEGWVKTNLYTVGGVLIGLALLQIIPICIAQNVVSDISAIKARWSTAHKAGFHHTHHHGHHRATAQARSRPVAHTSRQNGDPVRQSGRSRPSGQSHKVRRSRNEDSSHSLLD